MTVVQRHLPAQTIRDRRRSQVLVEMRGGTNQVSSANARTGNVPMRDTSAAQP
jgi:hypothetical protein